MAILAALWIPLAAKNPRKAADMRPLLILCAIVVLVLALAGIAWFVWMQHWPATTNPPPLPGPATSRPTADPPPAPTLGRVRWQPAAIKSPPLRILDKKWFTIGYRDADRSPAWVCYDLAGPIVNRVRSPDRPSFATDFATSAHVSSSDYTGSGFDRGHMVPAFAMWSRHGAEAFRATFIMSNVVPQPHHINARQWEDLEDDIAGQYNGDDGWAGKWPLTVINGPIYGNQPQHIGPGIPVPAACFSVVLRWTGSTYEGAAFIIPNEGSPQGPAIRFRTRFHEVERRAGLDLFAGEATAWRGDVERTDTAPW